MVTNLPLIRSTSSVKMSWKVWLAKTIEQQTVLRNEVQGLTVDPASCEFCNTVSINFRTAYTVKALALARALISLPPCDWLKPANDTWHYKLTTNHQHLKFISEEQFKAFIAKAKADQSIQEKLKADKSPEDNVGIAIERVHDFTADPVGLKSGGENRTILGRAHFIPSAKEGFSQQQLPQCEANEASGNRSTRSVRTASTIPWTYIAWRIRKRAASSLVCLKMARRMERQLMFMLRSMVVFL